MHVVMLLVELHFSVAFKRHSFFSFLSNHEFSTKTYISDLVVPQHSHIPGDPTADKYQS